MTMIPTVATSTVPEDQLQAALLQAVGFDKLSPAMRELALAIARQYGLDPMLRHLVMVEGKPYITRDGLLHVAHKSGVFDGIEVERPTLDEDGKYWRTWAKVYRKDMTRPFSYPGRYPATGGNARYNEEMAIKVAEVMTLRRAFDVAAPVIEERWAGDDDLPPDETDEPKSVSDKIAARAAAIEAEILAEDPSGPHAEGIGTVLAEMEEAGDIALVDSEEPPVADIDVETPSETPPEPSAPEAPAPTGPFDKPVPPPIVVADGPNLAEFAILVRDVDQARVKAIARELFPDLRKFGDLKPAQLARIVDRLAEVEDEDIADAIAAEHDLPGDSVTSVTFVPTSGPVDPPTPSGIKLCGLESPYGDGKTCTMDAGHGGGHHAGVTTSW